MDTAEIKHTDFFRRVKSLGYLCDTLLAHGKNLQSADRFQELHERVHNQLLEAVAAALHETLKMPIDTVGGFDEVTPLLRIASLAWQGTGHGLANELVQTYHERYTLKQVGKNAK